MSETTALAVRSEPHGPLTLAEAQTLAKTVASSGLIPDVLKGKPNDVLVILLTGQELGLKPMQALRSVRVIKGNPSMSADLMVALCKSRAEICEYFKLKESTAQKATYETRRRGDPEPTVMTYSIEDAQLAGLTGSDTYRKHPKAMLRARCSAALARAVYPDVVLGVYETGEGEEIEGRGPGMTDVEVQLKTAGEQAEKSPSEKLIEAAAANLNGAVVDAEVVDEHSDPPPPPALEGTQRQINWAVKIRNAALSELSANDADRFRGERSAKWWIDNREKLQKGEAP